MGQAALDLPDAIEPSAPAPLKSADDLLAQLAGQEIDRLLADAEPELQQKNSVDPHPETPEDDGPILPASEAELDELLKDAEREAAEVVDETAPLPVKYAEPAAAPAPAAYTAQVDALFKELNAEQAPVPQAAPAVQAAPSPAEQPTTADERAALTAPIATEMQPPHSAEQFPQAEQRTSLLVSLLELINAPFAACPDVLRETLGKIAILTLMNALGVLLYLFLFRQ